MKKLRASGVLLCLAAIQALGADDTRLAMATRWYSETEATQGKAVFETHCAACHGDHAQGAPGWNAGSTAPPPLDGGGHVAHHSLEQLLGKIEQGGLQGNGRMPAFGSVLTPPERRAALAYVQSLWPDEVYRVWETAQRPDPHHH